MKLQPLFPFFFLLSSCGTRIDVGPPPENLYGIFDSVVRLELPDTPQFFGIGDINGDGRPDIAFPATPESATKDTGGKNCGDAGGADSGDNPSFELCIDQEVILYYGQEDGSFVLSTRFPLYTAPVGPMRIADMNGDKRADIVYYDTSNLYIHFGGEVQAEALKSGKKVFSTNQQFFNLADKIETLDFNGDGKDDILMSGLYGGVEKVLLLKGEENKNLGLTLRDIRSGISPVRVEDLNFDGKKEIIAIDSENRQRLVVDFGGETAYPGLGPHEVVDENLGSVKQVVTYDINRDGVLDIVFESVSDLHFDPEVTYIGFIYQPEALGNKFSRITEDGPLKTMNVGYKSKLAGDAYGTGITLHFADFSGDGDFDLIALPRVCTALIDGQVDFKCLQDSSRSRTVYFVTKEQGGESGYVRHELDITSYLSIKDASIYDYRIQDMNGDGHLDLLIGIGGANYKYMQIYYGSGQ